MSGTTRKDIMSSWYLASLVKRYHTWPTIRIETIAEASHGVALIYLRLFASDPDDVLRHGPEHVRVARWCLENDLAELWSGDAPFPVKIRYPTMRAAHDEVERDANVALGVRVPTLSDEARRRVKICDLLQMWLFGLHELRLGNGYARPIVSDTLSAATMIAADDDYAVRAIQQFVEEHDFKGEADR